MLKRTRDEAGGWIVVLALVTCLGFTAAFAWEAHDAGRRHRETAEVMVRQYASTAAAQFLGRTRTQIDYYGIAPALRAILEWTEAHPNQALPTTSQLDAGVPGQQKQWPAFVHGVFGIRSGTIETGEGVTHDGRHAVESDLVTSLGTSPLEAREARLMAFDDGVRLALTSDTKGGIVGFQVRSSAAIEFFERSYVSNPLVPSLSEGGLVNEEIYIRVIDMTGEELYSTDGTWEPYTGVEYTVSDDFGDFLAGMTMQISLDPEASRRVLAGGIPTSRLPLLLAMLTITALLLIMAILQIRKERQLARLRSDFVSGVSHELRTPLTQIRMFSETLLLERTRTDGEKRRSLEIIDQEARRLAHLVENILQFSRAERGAIQISRSRVDLSSIIDETVDGFDPVARSRNVRVERRITARPIADADGDSLRQVLLNLLDNALKYGPAGQTISIGLTVKDAVARITVEDEGPGIPDEKRAQIWNRFYRLESDRNTAVGGSGIGLSVVRELVALHGGTVTSENREHGRGARFAVELPIVEDESVHPKGSAEPAEAN